LTRDTAASRMTGIGQTGFQHWPGSRPGHACITFAAVVYASALTLWDPTESQFFPRCLFFSASGLHCPGCGVQRAAHAVLHFRWMDALRFNILSICVIPFLTLAYCRWTARVWFLSKPPMRRPRPTSIRLTVAAVTAFWLLRNIPIPPLHLLSPP